MIIFNSTQLSLYFKDLARFHSTNPQLPTDALGWLTFFVKHIGPLIILALGCFCVYALQRVPDLCSTPLFCIVRVLMLIDIVNIAVSKFHDIPDEIWRRELFDSTSVTLVMGGSACVLEIIVSKYGEGNWMTQVHPL